MIKSGKVKTLIDLYMFVQCLIMVANKLENTVYARNHCSFGLNNCFIACVIEIRVLVDLNLILIVCLNFVESRQEGLTKP